MINYIKKLFNKTYNKMEMEIIITIITIMIMVIPVIQKVKNSNFQIKLWQVIYADFMIICQLKKLKKQALI